MEDEIIFVPDKEIKHMEQALYKIDRAEEDLRRIIEEMKSEEQC